MKPDKKYNKDFEWRPARKKRTREKTKLVARVLNYGAELFQLEICLVTADQVIPEWIQPGRETVPPASDFLEILDS